MKIEKAWVTGLLVGLFVLFPISLAAQERKVEKSPPAQVPDIKQAVAPDVKVDKTADKASPATAVSDPKPADQVPVDKPLLVPPAPLVVKTGESTIAIPVEALPSKRKYEERPVAMTEVIVGSRFGYRRDPFTRRSKFHSGLDIKAKLGDPIAASYPGIVKFAGWYSGYGNWVVVEHGGGITTHYAHLSGFVVEAGQKVSRGTLLGFAGSTGRATSPHLHYEVRIDGNPVDPLDPIPLDPDSDYFKASSPGLKPAATEAKPAGDTRTPVAPVRERILEPSVVDDTVKPPRKNGAKEKALPPARTAARCVI
ncbi:MAG TPA: M23 family metallopeptidase [Blastocatellia bacterium]|nr:M23 family metallopeptidase [Blastocatellia bacterium]